MDAVGSRWRECGRILVKLTVETRPPPDPVALRSGGAPLLSAAQRL
jgi:hypothetical protein